jgi:hypothetical protein
VGDVHDPPPIAALLQPYALAAVAMTAQIGMADQPHVLAVDAIGWCAGAHAESLRIVALGMAAVTLAPRAIQFCQ